MRGRDLVFVGAVLWMFGAPFVRQVLGFDSRALPQWRMFSGRGFDVCAIELRDGATGERIERLEALGYTRSEKAPADVRKVKKTQKAMDQARQVCEQLGLDDVRVTLRCPREQGWTTPLDGTQNACR